MPLTSDPHAWLRPFYARLAQHPAYRLLASSHQFEELLSAIATDHPSRAAAMREWTPAGQQALVGHLAMVHTQAPPTADTELWRLEKGARALVCMVRYVPTGIGRALDGGDRVSANAAHSRRPSG